jgi:hypothetical protein
MHKVIVAFLYTLSLNAMASSIKDFYKVSLTASMQNIFGVAKPGQNLVLKGKVVSGSKFKTCSFDLSASDNTAWATLRVPAAEEYAQTLDIKHSIYRSFTYYTNGRYPMSDVTSYKNLPGSTNFPGGFQITLNDTDTGWTLLAGPTFQFNVKRTFTLASLPSGYLLSDESHAKNPLYIPFHARAGKVTCLILK